MRNRVVVNCIEKEKNIIERYVRGNVVKEPKI